MSISLKVVNIAYVFWASFNRWAILSLILFILTLFSDRVETPFCPVASCPASCPTEIGLNDSAGEADIGADGLLGVGGGVVGGCFGLSVFGGEGGGAVVDGAAAGAPFGVALAAPAAPTFNLKTGFPGWTVAPSSTNSSSMTPAAGEWIGTEV